MSSEINNRNGDEFSLDEYNKALELFSHIPINSPVPNDISSLSDGVLLYEVLSH